MPNQVVTVDKNILGGTPVFYGTRVPVSILFDYLEDNKMEEFLENYPSVSRKQVLEVIKLASKILDNANVMNENFN